MGAHSATGAQSAGDDGIHLGVANCAGSNCHGAAQPSQGSSVRQDEYLISSQENDPHRIDSHHKPYTVLLTDRGLQIAHNLGLTDAASADTCLACHADNVPPDKRGPQFKLSDGVGCEVCHGAAAGWLGVHLSGAGHKANLAAKLYPTEQPIARGQKCLSCHLGDDKRVMTHRIMGAGHPPLPFELDTFTAIEPAHVVVDRSYVERKGPVKGCRSGRSGRRSTSSNAWNSYSTRKTHPRASTQSWSCSTVRPVTTTSASCAGRGALPSPVLGCSGSMTPPPCCCRP
jgi:hypothetical protein